MAILLQHQIIDQFDRADAALSGQRGDALVG